MRKQLQQFTLLKSKKEQYLLQTRTNIRVLKYYYYITGRQKPLPINIKQKFLTEDPFLPQLHSWFSSLGTTFEQKQQKFAASSPKTTWDKALSMKCTFARLTRQSKRLSRICWLYGDQGIAYQQSKTLFAEMLTNSGFLKIQFYLSG